MTLPRGFGGRTCFDCGRPRKYGETCQCKKETKSNNIIIPIKRESFGLYTWYGVFALFIILTIYVLFLNVAMGIVIGIFLLGFGQFMALPIFGVGYDKTKEQVYPWLIPLFNFIQRIKFIDD